MAKKITAVILAAITLLLSMSIMASAYNYDFKYTPKGYKTCSDPADVFKFVLNDGYGPGPIRIVRATLRNNGRTKNIYLIGLVGVETNLKQVNDVITAIPSAFDIDNEYTVLLKKTIEQNIPKGANLVFAGHSLGGMVAQQIITDKDIKADYNIIATVTAGSPYIISGKREGELNRLCDKYDVIPYLSGATAANLYRQLTDRHVEDGGYLGDPDSAHNVSYRLSEVWGDYDAIGVKDGNAVIRFNYANLKVFGEVLA